jgi:hypothetical protein
MTDQTVDTAKYKFRDEEYYSSKEYNLEDTCGSSRAAMIYPSTTVKKPRSRNPSWMLSSKRRI